MNTGTSWTKRRSTKTYVEPAKTSKAFRYTVFVTSIVAVVLVGGGVSAITLKNATRDTDRLASDAAQKSATATRQYTTLKTRLDQQAAYREYTKKATATMISSGTPDFSGAPLLKQWPHTDPTRLDAIVNKQYPIYPLNYEPQLSKASCGYGDTAELQQVAQADFVAMCQAAEAAGAPLSVTSTYRSYEQQLEVYHWWSVNGVSGADTDSARPGYSEHQLGLSVDFATPSGIGLENFAYTSQYTWLQANAAQYGFIQRYTAENSHITGYNAEVWHYRYIGRENATHYQQVHASSLEQFWQMTGGTYDTPVRPAKS